MPLKFRSMARHEHQIGQLQARARAARSGRRRHRRQRRARRGRRARGGGGRRSDRLHRALSHRLSHRGFGAEARFAAGGARGLRGACPRHERRRPCGAGRIALGGRSVRLQRHARCWTKAASRRCASSTICRITACSTRSACSQPVRCRGRSRSRGLPLGVPVCEDIWSEEACADPGQGRSRDLDRAERLALLDRTSRSSATASRGRAWPRRACRWLTSIRSAGRTSSSSTALPSCSTPMAGSPCRCRPGRRRLTVYRMAPRRRNGGAAYPGSSPRSSKARPRTISPASRACATMWRRTAFPGVVLGLSGGINSARLRGHGGGCAGRVRACTASCCPMSSPAMRA